MDKDEAIALATYLTIGGIIGSFIEPESAPYIFTLAGAFWIFAAFAKK